MGGLQRLFLRITPIIMLICFVCLGITHTFQQEGQPNITYLTTETIAIDDNNTETTEDDITITNYSFDFKSYRENIDNDIIKRSLDNLIDTDNPQNPTDIQKYQANLNIFKTIWEDGYDFGDITGSILNAVILTINTLILPINVVLIPIRITAGILLTAFSILGININRDTGIIKFFNIILDELSIPLINPTWDNELAMIGQTYYFKMSIESEIGPREDVIAGNYYFEFTSPSGGKYKQLQWITNAHDQNDTKIWYYDTDGYQILVYDSKNNGWQYQDSRTITIMSIEKAELLEMFLTANATKQ